MRLLGAIFVDGCVVGVAGFVAGERDIGAGLEELLPEFGAFPDRLGMFAILLDYGEDAGGDNSMCAAEVVVDLCVRRSDRRGRGTEEGFVYLAMSG